MGGKTYQWIISCKVHRSLYKLFRVKLWFRGRCRQFKSRTHISFYFTVHIYSSYLLLQSVNGLNFRGKAKKYERPPNRLEINKGGILQISVCCSHWFAIRWCETQQSTFLVNPNAPNHLLTFPRGTLEVWSNSDISRLASLSMVWSKPSFPMNKERYYLT